VDGCKKERERERESVSLLIMGVRGCAHVLPFALEDAYVYVSMYIWFMN
jgi:hypothetical protein